MLNFIGALIGLLLGAGLAWRRKGNWQDVLQWAAVFAVIGFLLGTFAMLVVPAPT